MSITTPYTGLTAAFASKYGKAEAVASVLYEALGILTVPAAVDTDQFGTFSGEMERTMSAEDACVAKCRLGMQQTGLPLGFASEGSFGPHPGFPMVPAGVESMVFIDDTRGLTLYETLFCEDTNFAQTQAEPGDDLSFFYMQAYFPTHSLIVRPSEWKDKHVVFKGLREEKAVQEALIACAKASADGMAWVETDMRASENPTRMQHIMLVAERLAMRLATPCPQCASPGFGMVEVVHGLPCAQCGTPTGVVKQEVCACAACGHREIKPRRDGLLVADPRLCERCTA